MTSGLRSLPDKTLTYFKDRLAERASRDEPFERLYQAVNLLAEQVRTVAHEDKAALHGSGMAFNNHALIGGQMERDARQKLYLLYPEGNWVDTGRLTPYHVIGSVGYGKPLLDRTLTEDSMRHACIRRAIEETPAELLDRAYDEIETAPPAPVSSVS